MNTTLEMYEEVIINTIESSRIDFLIEGVEFSILEKLKELWLQKSMNLCKPLKWGPIQSNKRINKRKPVKKNSATEAETDNLTLEITIPKQDTLVAKDCQISIKVPKSFWDTDVDKVISGPILIETMKYPESQRAAILQQHVNACISGEMSKLASGVQISDFIDRKQEEFQLPNLYTAENMEMDLFPFTIPQWDGANGMDEKGTKNDKNNNNNLSHNNSALNSEDSVSELDKYDFSDCENIIFCRYLKVNRRGNKWFFHFEGGEMNFNRQVYCFQTLKGSSFF